MIDLHAHILPNVDDGAQSMAVAIAMLDDYARMGFTTVVATPHWDYPTDDEQQEHIQETYHELMPLAKSRSIRLLLGRECMLPPESSSLSSDPRLAINRSRFLLVELPFSDRPLFLEQTLFELQTAGKVIILAHPERYRFIQSDLRQARELVDRGVLLQANIGSLKGTFGKPAKIAVEKLLALGLVHVAATDAHSDGGRLQATVPGIQILEGMMGQDGCRRLVHDNPEILLAGNIPDPVQIERASSSLLGRWFSRVRI